MYQFEDSIAGIQSIKQAGMYAIGVTADGPLPEARFSCSLIN